jgi:hypothetical protein
LETLIPHELVLCVQRLLNVEVQLFATRQHVVELVLAQDRSQCRLRQLARRVEIIFDLDDCLFRIYDTEIDDSTDFHGHVVTRNHVLRRHFEHDGTQIHPHHLLDAGHEDNEAGPFTRQNRPSWNTTPR